MALSEHEEQVLQEIARRLSEDDPKFVASVANATPAKLHLRRLRWAVVGFAAGFVTMLGLTFHFALGLAGFGLMLASVLVGASAVRDLGTGTGVAAHLRRALSSGRSDRVD